jgi:hypothetical protein
VGHVVKGAAFSCEETMVPCPSIELTFRTIRIAMHKDMVVRITACMFGRCCVSKILCSSHNRAMKNLVNKKCCNEGMIIAAFGLKGGAFN